MWYDLFILLIIIIEDKESAITNLITNEVISYYGYFTKYSEKLSKECILRGYKVFNTATYCFH